MKNIIFILFLLFTSITANAQQAIFADLKWGSTRTEVTKQLPSKGFPSIKTDEDGDLQFEGMLLGQKTIGFAIFTKQGLQKVQLTMLTPDHKVISIYRDLKKTLINKYGTPSNTYEYFKKPYYEGDGYEEQALRLGKARFSAFWNKDMYIEITEKLNIRITYESENWDDESKKRKAQEASVL